MMLAGLFSVIVVIGVFAFGVIVSGAEFLWYIDLPSALVVLVPSALLVLGNFGWRGVCDACAAVYGKERRSPAEMAEAAVVVSAFGRYAWFSAGMGTFIGAIAILAAFSQSDRLGPNLAVALICGFYALMLNFLFVAPAKDRLAKKIAARTGGE